MGITDSIRKSIDAHNELLNNADLLSKINIIAEKAVGVFRSGGRVLLCGNGGSAADAQHIAAELSGRFKAEREPLDAEALHVNTSYLTAVANDYSFDIVYERLVKAKGRAGDMLIAISTSGNSENIIRAVRAANELEMFTVGLTGKTGGKLKTECQILLDVPSEETPVIQQLHILIGHIFCELIDYEITKL